MIFGAHSTQALFTITVDNIVNEKNKVVSLINKTLKRSKTISPINILRVLFTLEARYYKRCTMLLKYDTKFG